MEEVKKFSCTTKKKWTAFTKCKICLLNLGLGLILFLVWCDAKMTSPEIMNTKVLFIFKSGKNFNERERNGREFSKPNIIIDNENGLIKRYYHHETI